MSQYWRLAYVAGFIFLWSWMDTVDILEAFDDAIEDSYRSPVPLTHFRRDFIDVWLAKDAIEAFFDLFYRLEDDYSRDVFLRLFHHSLGKFFAGDDPLYNYRSQKEWNALREAASMHPLYEPDYSLDTIETYILEGYTYSPSGLTH